MSDNNTRFVEGVPRLHLMLSTGCGLGFVPVAPATVAGFVGLVVWYAGYLLLPADMLFVVTLAMIVLTTIIGVWTANVMERYWGADPRAVVIDEFVGTWIPLLVAADYPLSTICGLTQSVCFGQEPLTAEASTAIFACIGFALFRLIDIYKPLGCRWIDRNVKGGFGCVLDDILAGTYALVILILLRWFVWRVASVSMPSV